MFFLPKKRILRFQHLEKPDESFSVSEGSLSTRVFETRTATGSENLGDTTVLAC